MEKLKAKHDHSLTDILKVIIFSLVLLLPGILFIPNIFYYGFNEHAQAQESEVTTTIDVETTTALNYENAQTLPSSNSDIELNKIYLWDSRKVASQPNFTGGSVTCSYINIIDYHDVSITTSTNSKKISAMLNITDIYTGTSRYNFNITSGYATALIMISAQPTGWNDFYTGLSLVTFDINQSSTSTTTTTTTQEQHTMSISDSIYTAWEDMWQSKIFSWTNNTPFNGSLNGFISIFGINAQSYLANVLIWLLSMTAIYVVLDIVIGVFKWLTHLIGTR